MAERSLNQVIVVVWLVWGVCVGGGENPWVGELLDLEGKNKARSGVEGEAWLHMTVCVSVPSSYGNVMHCQKN